MNENIQNEFTHSCNNDIWNQNMKTILYWNHIVLGGEQVYHPTGYQVLDVIDTIVKKYKNITTKLKQEFEHVQQVIDWSQTLKRDIQVLVQTEFNLINDLDTLIHICSHSLFRTLKKELNICDIVKNRLQHILQAYSTYVYDENVVLDLKLKDFVTTVKHLVQVSNNVRKIIDNLFCKCMYIEDVKGRFRSLLESVRTILFSAGQSSIRRNDDLNIDFKSYSFEGNMTNDTCCICLDDFSQEDEVVVLQCSHNFHKDCISESFKYQQKCPLCRCEIIS